MRVLSKKGVVLLVVLTMIVGLMLTGCGKPEATVEEPTGQETTEVVEPAPGVDQVFRINIAQEPTILDPFQFRDDKATSIIYATHEPLLRIAGDGKDWKPGLAEGVDVNADATVFTLHLREGAMWSDGTEITAADVVYSFQRAVDPVFGSEKAFDYYEILNAEAIVNGEMKPADLGVKALDDYTVEFTLKRSLDFFVDYLKMPGFAPIQKAAGEMHKDLYGTEPDKMVYSGPFVMTEWVHDSSITLEKNENYWDAENVALDTIEISLILEANTVAGMYLVGDLDFMEVPSDLLPQYAGTSEFMTMPQTRVSFIEFNPGIPYLDNIKIREALSIAFDRQIYVEKILATGDVAAYGLIPPGVRGLNGGDFREQVGNVVTDMGSDPTAGDRAVKLLEEGLAEMGKTKKDMEDFLDVLCIDSPGAIKNAQAIQAMWKQTLELELTVTPMQVKMLIPMLMDGTFHSVVGGGRTGTTTDAAYFIDFIYYENKWDDATYTEMIEKTFVTTGDERIQILMDIEKYVLDKYIFIPQNNSVANYVVRDGVANFVRYPIAVQYDLKDIVITK